MRARLTPLQQASPRLPSPSAALSSVVAIHGEALLVVCFSADRHEDCRRLVVFAPGRLFQKNQ